MLGAVTEIPDDVEVLRALAHPVRWGILRRLAAEPGKFLMPGQSDLRYQWVHVRLGAIDQAEMAELVLDAWRMCVPKKVAASYLESQGL